MTYLLAILGSACAVVGAIAGYYNLVVKKKPKVFVGNVKLRSFLETHVPLLKEDFSPSPLYWEGRLQTILGLVYRDTKPKRFPYKRELFTLKDGGEVALDFAMVEEEEGVASTKNLVVLLFPGLTSSSQTCYVKTMVHTLNRIGASVVIFNNRGLGGVPFKTARTYSASNIEDAIEVIAYLREKFHSRRMMALGTSLGAMVLSKYLVTRQEEAAETFDAAVIISIPWDANGGTANLETSLINRYLINRELTKSLVTLAKKFLKTVEPPANFNIQGVLKAKTVREFDAAVTAPQFGFASVEDYYHSATLKGHTHKFSIPVFSLNAEDDPMAPACDLPTKEALLPTSNLALITTSHGGHLGFLEGVGNKTEHFMERFVEQLVYAIQLHGDDLRSK